MTELLKMEKKLQVSGACIIRKTKTQVLAINMFITCSAPLSRRNDTPGTHEILKVVWEQAKFDTVV